MPAGMPNEPMPAGLGRVKRRGGVDEMTRNRTGVARRADWRDKLGLGVVMGYGSSGHFTYYFFSSKLYRIRV